MFNKILNGLLYLLGLRQKPQDHYVSVDQSGTENEPLRLKIDRQAVFAWQEGHLVVIIDHQFNNIPSWAEWDASREVLSVTHMNGAMVEAPASLQAAHIGIVMAARKLLLVSNDQGEKIMHFLPFLGRS